MNKEQLQLVTFEQAKKLKALGFDWETQDMYWSDGDLEDCMGLYNHNNGGVYDEKTYSAPPVALALKWVRDKKNIQCGVDYVENMFNPINKIFYKGHYQNLVVGEIYEKFTQKFDTYEAAEYALLDKLLTVLEKKNAQ
jgi:hypothetical protein